MANSASWTHFSEWTNSRRWPLFTKVVQLGELARPLDRWRICQTYCTQRLVQSLHLFTFLKPLDNCSRCPSSFRRHTLSANVGGFRCGSFPQEREGGKRGAGIPASRRPGGARWDAGGRARPLDALLRPAGWTRRTCTSFWCTTLSR